MNFFSFFFSENFLIQSIAYAIPLIFAALAALISNKAGILSINIEGSMSVAAVVGALVSHFSNSWIAGLLAGCLASIAMMMILAFASSTLKTDPFLTGIALNTMASGLAVLCLSLCTGNKGSSAEYPSVLVPNLHIPFVSDLPVIGKAFFGQNYLFYLGLVSLLIVWLVLEKTKLGASIKGAGFNALAERSVGISVTKTRYFALAFAGLFAGLGGCYLSMASLSFFSTGMVAGRGFIGIAAEAMGADNPFLSVLFAYIFGAVDYFAVGAQTVLSVPYELLNTLPYAMTIVALVIYSLVHFSREKKKALGGLKA